MAIFHSLRAEFCGRARPRYLLMILGAGSSIPVGMPSVQQLDNLVRKWSAQQAATTGTYDDVADAWPRLAAYCAAAGAAGPDINFELVLRELVGFTNWLKPAPFGDASRAIVGGAFPDGMTFPILDGYGPAVAVHANVAEVLRQLAVHMRRLSANLNTASPEFLRYKKMMDAFGRAFNVGVYNLNYDTGALTAFPDAFVGFAPDGTLRADAIHERREWSFVYHLHGNVHHSQDEPFGERMLWKTDLMTTFNDGGLGNSARDVSDGKSVPNALIVGGHKLDQLLIEPYQSFYSSLVRHAHLADAVVIAGYGFGDAHVNAALRSRMTSGRDRPRVMILDFWELLDRHPLPVHLRATERWHFEMSRALRAEGAFEHPRRSVRLDQNLFEVDENFRLAIWYQGFTEAADHIYEIIKWLDD